MPRLLQNLLLIIIANKVFNEEIIRELLANTSRTIDILKHISVISLDSTHQSKSHAALLFDLADDAGK